MAAPKSKTGLSDEIIAFANSAKVAQQLLNEDNDTPMAIKEFSFIINYDLVETYKTGLEIGFAYWVTTGKATANYSSSETTKLTIKCTLVPLLVYAPGGGGVGSDQE